MSDQVTISVGVCTLITDSYSTTRIIASASAFSPSTTRWTSATLSGSEVILVETATSILAVTAKHSLFPASYAQPTIALSCDSVSTLVGQSGIFQFRMNALTRLGAAFTPVTWYLCNPRRQMDYPVTYLLVQASQPV